jgi:dephospho-CoA kinase
MTRIVGLSGGLATGKSTVCDMLRRRGAHVLEADALHRAVLAPGSPAVARIEAAFGPAALDAAGAPDPAALAAIVRGDPAAAVRLGELMHAPWIGEMLRAAAAARDAGEALVVLAIPMLFDGLRRGAPWTALLRFDATVCVWAPRALQIARIRARDGSSQAEAEQRLDRQLPSDEQRSAADYTIDNAGTREDTARQVDALHAALVAGPPAASGRSSA